MYFRYGEKEITHLKLHDTQLAVAIDKIGYIKRVVSNDMFATMVKYIIGQQISTKAQETIIRRLLTRVPEINEHTILELSLDSLQSVGISLKKATWIHELARNIQKDPFLIEALSDMTDKEIIKSLTAMNGIGSWTAEMLMIFCMQRKDVVSYGDLAIIRGMRMLYQQPTIDRSLFQTYTKRYSPYGTIASFYLWAIAKGAFPELEDPKLNMAK